MYDRLIIQAAAYKLGYISAVRNWCVQWAYESGPDSCTEHTGQELIRALSIRVRTWFLHWAYGSGTDTCTEHTSQELILALSAQVPSKHAEHTRQELMSDEYPERTCQKLMRTLSVRVRNWCVRWAYVSGIDAYPERTCQELMHTVSMRIRN
jgi:hypothetical protein